jgi:hypothetical protein
MIWSVSMLSMGGTIHPGDSKSSKCMAHPAWFTRGSRAATALRRPSAAMPGTCGRPCLAGLRSCGCSCYAYSPGQTEIAVHGDAHRAAGFAPLRAGRFEHARRALRPRPALDHGHRARHHQHAYTGATLAPFQHATRRARKSSMRELVQLPMNTTSPAHRQGGLPGFEAHVRSALQRTLVALLHRGDRARLPMACPCRDCVPQVIIGVEPWHRSTMVRS